MLGESCLMCDCFIEEKGFAWYLGHVFCSNECVLEWNELSFEDQKRYLECQQALDALRGEWHALIHLVFVFSHACIGGVRGLLWSTHPRTRIVQDEKNHQSLRSNRTWRKSLSRNFWQKRRTPAVANNTRRKSNPFVEQELNLMFFCIQCKKQSHTKYGIFREGNVCSRICNDTYEKARSYEISHWMSYLLSYRFGASHTIRLGLHRDLPKMQQTRVQLQSSSKKGMITSAEHQAFRCHHLHKS